MKRLSLLLLSVLFQALAFAQLAPIAEGPMFQEDISGYARILQMKNGNTIYLHLTVRSGIDLNIYDNQHKLKVVKHLDPAFGILKGACINAIYEIDGNITLMISEVEDRRPLLYRLIINGVTGELEREDKIGETSKYLSRDLPFIPEYPSVSSFTVRKDPDTDNYALLIRKNNDDAAGKNQIEAIFYNHEHQEINRGYYESPYRYGSLNFLDMVVIGGDKLHVLGFAYNQIAANDREGQLIMATLEKGARKMKTEILSMSGDRLVDSAIVRYNPVTQKLLLLGSAHVEDAEQLSYAGFLLVIDPSAFQIEKEINIYPEKANVMKKEIYGQKAIYTGMPQALSIHKDGGFTVLFEELTKISVNHLDAASYNYYLLDHIAITNFDVTGKEINTAFIPKKQHLKSADLASFYPANRDIGAQKLIMGDQYKSFVFVETKDRSYVLLNDMQDNTPKLKTDQLTAIRGVAECDAFCYTLDAQTAFPNRTLFFGKPKKKNEHFLGLFNISDYDKEKNIFVTLKLTRQRDLKGASLVWLSL